MLINAILHDLFVRQAFISSLLGRNFNQTSGQIELAGVLALMATMFFLPEYLINKYFPGHQRSFLPLWHIDCRLLRPLLVVITGALTLPVCNLAEFRVVQLHLLISAARWIVLIRTNVVVVHVASLRNRLTDWLERVVSVVLQVGFILWLSGFDDKILETLEATRFTIGSGKSSLLTTSNRILRVGILMIGMSRLARFIDEWLGKSSLGTSLSMILSKVIKTVMVVLTVLVALPLIGVDLTVLSMFGDTLGVGIGFNLQKMADNYISGFIILDDRSVRMNDRLTVNNLAGYVTEITSRFVVLRNANGTEALIPSETFVTSMVVSESYTSRELQQAFNIQVAYHSDLIKALDVIKNVAVAQPRVSVNPVPSTVVTSFGDSGVDLCATYWMKDPEDGLVTLQSAIFLDIWRQFNEHGVEFPHPQREIHILNKSLASSNTAVIKAGMQARSDTKSGPAMGAAGDG